MPLKTGHYLIINSGKCVGRPLIEDRSNNPKPIILLPRGFREQEIKWVIEGDDHKGYTVSIRGDPTAPIDSKVFALLHEREKAEKWHIEPVKQRGPNRYVYYSACTCTLRIPHS
ncbi:hypothetical protein GYMLUDRAFT_41585 [Collybiopsis luxurians FD-317 M1]|uniref:Uncharacterized protein n=1 Tax=Collybiopsis luxurians FD-317 M1 TaxID=944289 RepID=A0A0D0CIX6_9AGAR|nr:hypothetical protein GYMLUDRAFT_41585 [Collybiopsis luxurians FD-317 M1]